MNSSVIDCSCPVTFTSPWLSRERNGLHRTARNLAPNTDLWAPPQLSVRLYRILPVACSLSVRCPWFQPPRPHGAWLRSPGPGGAGLADQSVDVRKVQRQVCLPVRSDSSREGAPHGQAAVSLPYLRHGLHVQGPLHGTHEQPQQDQRLPLPALPQEVHLQKWPL